MPTIVLTITDTPAGAVAIHSSFKPAVGAPCSPAQAAALEMISRTHKQWVMQPPPAACELGTLLAGATPPFCADAFGA